MMETIQLTGRQARNFYAFLGGLAKVSEHDRTKQGKLRHRCGKLLQTNDEGEHEALGIVRIELRYTIQDLAAGVAAEHLGEIAKGPDGKPLERITYTPEKLSAILGEFRFDAAEKDALFRLFRARWAAAETNGELSEAIYKIAGLFPNMQRALEIAQKAAGAKEPGFVEPSPDALHGGDSEESGDDE